MRRDRVLGWIAAVALVVSAVVLVVLSLEREAEIALEVRDLTVRVPLEVWEPKR